MKIVKKIRDGKTVPFGDLHYGDVFIFDGAICLKLRIYVECRGNALNLDKMLPVILTEDARCIKLKATLVWEEDDE